MKRSDETVSLSASDLSNHLGCRHLTTLDLAAARGELKPPVFDNPTLAALVARGQEHERAYLDHLRGQGLEVLELDPHAADSQEQTLQAMRRGVDVIAQASLARDGWRGRADVLLRVPLPSNLGAWSYQVLDTKLSRQTRAGTILQLCLYSQLVTELQGVQPEHMHVVTPATGFAPETFRVSDYLAYHHLVQQRLQQVVSSSTATPATYPEPVPQCDVCRWWKDCNDRRHRDDHLSLVAGISSLQRKELAGRDITTLAALADVPLPITPRPRRGSVQALERVREQARVQLEARQQGEPVFELLPVIEEQGLCRLPEPAPGDIFFDIEGDPFVGTQGLEYLLGWVVRDSSGTPAYQGLWAHDAASEKQAFEQLVDVVMQAWKREPGLHVYHYAPYESGALKRLSCRHATREDAVDRLLRAEVLVDLHAVVKQALRAGVERYSIKDLEVFYGFTRQVELREASKNLRAMELAFESGLHAALEPAVREVVQGYNREDCLSTLHLRDWLEELRADLVAQGTAIARPPLSDGAPSEALDARRTQATVLFEQLINGLPVEASERSPEQQASWLLAHLLEWHRREAKSVWWEYFRLKDLDDEELLDERQALAGLVFKQAAGGTAACPVHRYAFPAQECDLRQGEKLYASDGIQVGMIDDLDLSSRRLAIKKTRATASVHPTSVFTHTYVSTSVQEAVLMQLGQWVADHGVDADGPFRAARDLLLGRAPRLSGQVSIADRLQGDDETTLEAARRLVLQLDQGVLAIQGPPGTGKTYTGARMICELVRAGKKVGVAANSHKVIRNLLDKVVEAATESELQVRCLQKVKEGGLGNPAVVEVFSNDEVDAAIANRTADVIGGTAWLWSRPDLATSVDVLFVDEAGQMALVNALAVSQAASSLVLLGDPQQLEQPLQGSHPEGAAASALEHLLAGHPTMPPGKGLFLGETWRLHPAICKYTSELFYEDRLVSRPGLDQQVLRGAGALDNAGLHLVTVAHQGNQNASPEEVERVAALHAQLTGGVQWRDHLGEWRQVSSDDVLIVAPYNAQVAALCDRLPGARVGTVDKFQGQEAPVVIYSLTTSSPEEAPRGLEFLYSLNRLNVASSRARCACILVASPLLFEPDCRTPRQIRLASALCRYRELAAT